MTKEEIITRKEDLIRKVKTPGRTHSKSQRDEIRNEISVLQIELEKIKLEEDNIYISDFRQKYPSHLISEKDALKCELDGLVSDIADPNIKFVLESKVESIYREISDLTSHQKTINELIEALDYLNRNETIPSRSEERRVGKECRL